MTESSESLSNVGRAVRVARLERKWSQTKLGDEAGVSRPTIARIERGDDISLATLTKVTAAIGLTVRIDASA
jgi:transcriptional regulator with XRE-family HTH domain